jgi:glycosyltransferase involved in cell wall biosynthesis
MSNQVYFSIVIPTYNRADFIVKTIRSLLSQQYGNFEIIVVDDGSTDNTDQLVLAIDDKRVSYHKKQNAERGAARNYGARLAKGDYINFFDSDDVAYDNHLAVAGHTAIGLKSPQVFHLGYDVKDPAGNLLKKAADFPPTVNEWLINGNHLSCNGVFIRKDIALNHPFSETRALSGSEDYALWLRLASRFPFYCVNDITSTVVNHDARSVIRINKNNFLRRIELLQQETLEDPAFVSCYSNRLALFKAFLNIYIALHLAMAENPRKENFPYLVKAVQLKPNVIFSYRFLAALKNVIL